MSRDDFSMLHSLRVRWAEVDRQDVVFNGNYFLYFDVAVAGSWCADVVPARHRSAIPTTATVRNTRWLFIHTFSW